MSSPSASAASSASSDKLHIVFAGNPGVGKSFILNALVGEVRFESGLSFGEGLTQALQTYEPPADAATAGPAGPAIYSDTPGLDDLRIRDRAAAEITRALHQSRRLKLIFVVTLEDGRVRPSDLTTIGVILQAIEHTGVRTLNKYAVAVNKCNAGELAQLDSPRNRAKVRAAFATVQPLEHLGFFPRHDCAAGRDNVLLAEPAAYRRFVDAAPELVIPHPENVSVDVSQFDRIKADLEQQLEALKRKLAAVEREREDRAFYSRMETVVGAIVSLIAGRALDGVAARMFRKA